MALANVIPGQQEFTPLVGPDGQTVYAPTTQVPDYLRRGFQHRGFGVEPPQQIFENLLEQDAKREQERKLKEEQPAPFPQPPRSWIQDKPQPIQEVVQREEPTTDEMGVPIARPRPTVTPIPSTLPGFRPLNTTTDPQGVIRINPQVSQHLDDDQRLVAEAYLNAFAMSDTRPAHHVTPEGGSQTEPEPGRRRHYQLFGTLLDDGQTVLKPDGSTAALPPGFAYQPSTGQVYHAPPINPDFIRFTFLPLGGERGGQLGPAVPGFIKDPLEVIERASERMMMGLWVPDDQMTQEAVTVAGLASTGAFGIQRGREALAGTAGARPVTTVGTAGTPRTLRGSFEDALAPAEREAFNSLSPAIQDALRKSSNPMMPSEIKNMLDEGVVPERAIIRNLGYPPDRGGTILGTAGAPRSRRQAPLEPPPQGREADPAGFHIHALEVAQTRLPTVASPERMRREFLRHEVDEAEMRALRLDELLQGPVAAAAAMRREAYQDLSRLAFHKGEALRRYRQHPDNPEYRRSYQEADSRFNEGRITYQEIDRHFIESSRNQVTSQREAINHLGNQIGAVNKELAKATTPARRVELLQQRSELRQRQSEARQKLGDIAKGADRATNQRITAKEIEEHIRANRPVLETFVRKWPPEREQLGSYWEGVQKIRANQGEVLAEALAGGRGGQPRIAWNVAREIAKQLSETPPIEWSNAIRELNQRLMPGVNRLDLSTTVGRILDPRQMHPDTISDMVTRLQRIRNRILEVPGYIAPRYSFAVLDKMNPTLQEIAIHMTSAGKGKEVPKMVSSHWRGDLNVVAHMQTTMQRVASAGDRVARMIDRVDKRISALEQEAKSIIHAQSRSGKVSIAQSRRYGDIYQNIRKLEIDRDALARRMPDTDTIYLGNQFQSDAPRKHSVHPLVGDVKRWLRPTLEMFIDEGIKSGARYIAIPSGKTVAISNTINDRVIRFYDDIVPKELNFVLRRRGIKPVSRRTVERIFPIDNTYGRQTGFTGRWHLIELPRDASRGMRLYEGAPVPVGGTSGQIQDERSRQ